MKRLAFVFLGLALGSPALAQDRQDTGFHVADFRASRAAAVKAVNAGDYATAEARLAEARAMVPSAPSILLLGAQIELTADKADEAKTFLRDYIRRGLWFDRTNYPGLAAIMDADMTAALDANAAPLGTFTEVARVDDLALVEGVAVDSAGQVYASSVHHGALNRVADGRISASLPLPPGQGGYGIAVRGNNLWLATASNAVSDGYVATTAAPSQLLRLDTTTGKLTHFMADRETRSFGDIGLGQKDIYTSDGAHGGVFRLTESDGMWQTLIVPGTLGSPQGMVETTDGHALIVADYTSGLYRVDLASSHVTRLAEPSDASLVGVDGMTADGDDIIAVQNGITPARVLRIHLSQDGQAIDSVEVLLRGGVLDQPTGGRVVGHDFIFVARSQWSDFDDDGKAIAGPHGPVIIGDLKLQ